MVISSAPCEIWLNLYLSEHMSKYLRAFQRIALVIYNDSIISREIFEPSFINYYQNMRVHVKFSPFLKIHNSCGNSVPVHIFMLFVCNDSNLNYYQMRIPEEL